MFPRLLLLSTQRMQHAVAALDHSQSLGGRQPLEALCRVGFMVNPASRDERVIKWTALSGLPRRVAAPWL